MRHLLAIGVLVIAGLGAQVSAESSTDDLNRQWVAQELGSGPLAFTRNMGQWDERALFRANVASAALWITADGVCYEFARRIATVNRTSQSAVQSVDHADLWPEAARDSVETLVLKTSLVGANRHPSSYGDNLMDYRCNYFYGNDPAGWYVGVPNYQAVVLEDVYPGIDLTYYGNANRLEYDFRVAARADYSRIQLEYHGAEKIAVDDSGVLVVTTAWGELRELAPVVYQEVRGVRRTISAEYRMTGGSSFGFRLGSEFDPSLPTVIDPVLVYSSYLGGALNEGCRGIAVDRSGAAYVTGETFSADYPTQSPYQNSLTGYFNVFVSKLTRAGNGLVYSTFLGGGDYDAGAGLAVDSSGNVCVVGFTTSTDFPVVGALQGEYGGGSSDVFVAKIANNGGSLIFCTYLGGSGWDVGDGIFVHASGAVYVVGSTSSTDFPLRGAFQNNNRGGYDAFVAKFNGGGDDLVYSTYLGGNLDDDANSVVVDAAGSAYLTGRTLSIDFPVSGYFQGERSSAYLDVFVTKLAPEGDDLVYSTYLGGTDDDYGYGIAIDSLGAAFVTGRTKSTDFPVLNAYQGVNQGAYDVFITKFNTAGNALSFSTLVGGTADDYGHGIVVDRSGTVYVAGRTFSGDFPVFDAYQAAYQGGPSDACVVRLSADGSNLEYSTFLGGCGYDGAHGIAIDTAEAIYVTGFTDSDDFPTRVPYQAALRANSADVFVTKLAETIGPDQDGDDIPDAADNCPEAANTGQADANRDGIGDACCCVDRVGDANGAGGDEPTIGDVSALIDAKFVSGDCVAIACMAEADINLSGGLAATCDDVSIGDITALIDYLFITGSDRGLPGCL